MLRQHKNTDMKTRTLLTLMALTIVMLIVACKESPSSYTPKEEGDAMDRIEQLYKDNKFVDALAVCDSMLQNETYRVDSLSIEENNHRYIVIMRSRIMILGYLRRQVEAVSDMKTLAEFCNNSTDDEENFYSSVAAQMNVKAGLAQIDMGRTDEGFATMDKGINAMKDKKSKNARLATVNFMHDKAKALEAQNREDEAINLSAEALERIKNYRDIYADNFANKQDLDVQEFCNFYEGNIYAFLANTYVHKAEDGEAEGADSVRLFLNKAMKVPYFSEMRNCDNMLIGVYCFLNMQPEFERAYRQVEEQFTQDSLAYFYINVQKQAAEMAQRRGNNSRALAIMKRVVRLQSLRIKDDSMKRVAEAANAYQVVEMHRLQHETEVSRLRWIIMAVCLGFISLAVGIALFLYYRRNRHAYRRYSAIIAKHDANEMVIRALQLDPNTTIDYLLTLTGEARPEELEQRFALINGMSLSDFRTRLRQDDMNDGEDTLHSDTKTEAPEPETFLEKFDRVLQTNDRIFAEDLSRKDIAKDMNMPMVHILENLKELTGCTLSAYITQKRLEHAAHLLVTTNDKIESICFASGFTSVATFYRLFTKHYNCPPAEYRASQGQ